MYNKEYLEQLFIEQFGLEPNICVKSPGRINIIGEHTDYNNGFVMPAAIDKYIYVGLSKRNDNKISLYSADYKESYTTAIHDTIQPIPEWAKYILGAAIISQSKTDKVIGFNLYVIGDVPLGAGLSSSAALSCATVFALNEIYNIHLSKIDIANISQQIEHEYIGVNCGIMDQFASVMGKANHAIKLDCQNLSYEYVPIDWSNYDILLLNTNVKHSLASSAYNDRRKSCEQGVAWVKAHIPDVKSLRDVNMEQLEKYVFGKDKDVFYKCKFVIEENLRLQEAAKALVENNFSLLGKLLFDAHWALSKEYEVSCPELDYLVQAAQTNSYVVGARMMGGGFGGCTINIIQKGKSQDFISYIETAYQEHFGLPLTPIDIKLSDGTSIIN